jgi:ABC-type oligopeptide transport system ATPase subunit
MTETLVQIDSLTKEFRVRTSGPFTPRERFTAVDDISLTIPKGKTTGLIGESGSGKSTVARLLLRLTNPTSGTITYGDTNITNLSRKELLRYYRSVQIIFQDSGSSFNPRKTVGEQIFRPMRRLGVIHTRKQAMEIIHEMFARVGLKPDHVNRYPHEFSGGQRQRLGIARALTVQPEFLILDEPTSALDVSIQAQILNLLLDLQDEFGFTYLFIGHDLGIVEFFCDQIAVMYKGMIVEEGDIDSIYRHAQHPVTRELVDSILSLDTSPLARDQRAVI